MPKKNRVAIYEYLFKEGVMVAKKDYHASKHPELENIPNLQVIKAMQVTILNISFTLHKIRYCIMDYENFPLYELYVSFSL